MRENEHKLGMIRQALRELDGPAAVGEIYVDKSMADSNSNRMRLLFENPLTSARFCRLITAKNKGISVSENVLPENGKDCRVTRTGRRARHIVSITFPWVPEE